MGRPTPTGTIELDERIQAAALDAFLSQGYDRTTVDSVVRAARTTPKSLYARYKNKRTLFVAVITLARIQLVWDHPDFETDLDDLECALTEIARSAVARELNPLLVRLNQLVMAEAHRFEELVLFKDQGVLSPRVQTVVELLRRHEQKGAIAVPDLTLTAEQFLSMVSLMPARLAAVGVSRSSDEEERHIKNAVSLMLLALRCS